MFSHFFYTILIWIGCISISQSADILITCPTASFSHQQPFLIMAKELLARNHSVTLVTCNPEVMKPHVNLTIVDLSFNYEIFRKGTMQLTSRFSLWKNLQVFGVKFSTRDSYLQWEHPNMKQLVHEITSTNKTYDLLFLEPWCHQSYWALVDLVGKPPVIMLSTAYSFTFVTLPFNNPENPSYVPIIWTSNTDAMSFTQRFTNTLVYIYYYKSFMNMFEAEQEIIDKNIDKKYLPRKLIDIFYDSAKYSYMGSYDSRITGYPKPIQPKIIEVGPLHLVQPKELDKELETWFNGSEKGVIYFSLGSNMKSSLMGENRKKAFLKAFLRFPQYRILWKYETDEGLDSLSNNILIKKWTPQQDILAHPKVKLFIMQGGLQSMQEAFNYGVKLICIPMFGDQDMNCARISKIKTGIVLNFETLNEDIIYNALKTVLEDPIYENNMKYYSIVSKDSPMSPIEKSIWWVEYMLRHKGAEHLHSHVANMNWIQYFLIDVIVVILILIISVLGILYFISKEIWRLFQLKFRTKLMNKKIKKN